MFGKVCIAAVAVVCASADLPVVEVRLAGNAEWSNALSAMEKTREQMENRFVAQLREKVAAVQKTAAPEVSRAISSVLDLHTALFQTEKDTTARHAALMQARSNPTALRVRVSGASASELIDVVAKHEAKLNAREEEMFKSALASISQSTPSRMFLESQGAGDQEFAIKVAGAGAGAASFIDAVETMAKHRAAKLGQIRMAVTELVAKLAQKGRVSFLQKAKVQGGSSTSFPEFNVQYYHPSAAAASLRGTETEVFTKAVDAVLAKQEEVIKGLEKGAHRAFLMQSDRVTQSPMVWLNLRGAAHASLLSSAPLAESQATVNVFEAPGAMLLQPESLSSPFEQMDFFVEQGQGSLPGEASLQSLSKASDAMLRKVKSSASLLQLPAFKIHVPASSGAQAVQLSEAQQSALLAHRQRLVDALKDRRQRLSQLRASLQ